MDRAFSYHNFARPYGTHKSADGYGYTGIGTKARSTEFQASMVITHIDTADQEIARREDNANYLKSKLKDIPGIVPRKEYPGTNRVSHFAVGFRYKAEQFDGLSRSQFVKAVGAEGIPIGTGLELSPDIPKTTKAASTEPSNPKPSRPSTPKRKSRITETAYHVQ